MEFGLSSEQTLLQDSVNRFLREQVPLDKVRQLVSADIPDQETWQGLTDLGLPGLLISEANGGLGLGTLDAAIVAESLGYHVTPSPFLSSAVIAPVALQAAGVQEDLSPSQDKPDQSRWQRLPCPSSSIPYRLRA